MFASEVLDQWLQQEIALSEMEIALIRHLQALLIENAEGWNEQELSLHFIGPMFSLIHFTEPYRFNLFAERRISAVVTGVHSDVELYGEPVKPLKVSLRILVISPGALYEPLLEGPAADTVGPFSNLLSAV